MRTEKATAGGGARGGGAVDGPTGTKSGHVLAKAMFGISGVVICAKVFGFGEKVVIAHYHGTTRSADVYFGVMGILWSVVFLAKELLYPSLLPTYSGALSSGRNVSGGLFRRMFLVMGGVMTLVASIMFIGAPWIIRIFLPGLVSGQSRTAGLLLRALGPGVICLGLMVVTYTCLNARKRFVVSAFGEAMFKLFIVAGLIAMTPILGIHAIGPVIGAGGICCLLFHLYYLPDRRQLLVRGGCDSAAEEAKSVRRLMKPLVVGVVFSHVSALVDNALASTLPGGQLSCLGYGKKLIDAVVLIGPVAIVTVVYSQAAHLSASGRHADIPGLIAKAVRLLLYVCVPLTFILVQLRFPLTSMLFQRGRFDAISVSFTAGAVMVYGCGIVTFALEALFVYCFYALSDTRTPVTMGIIFVFVDIVLAVVLMRYYQYLGIAGALVAAKTGKVICLGWLLRARLGGLLGAGPVRFLLKLTAAAMVLAVTIRIVRNAASSCSWSSASTLSFALPALAGVAAFVLCSYAVKLEECRSIVSIAIQTLSGRGKAK